MKIKEIHLKSFKRFSDLTIHNIPETAKLVILVGPNGSGKSSLFEGLHFWYRNLMKGDLSIDKDYHIKSSYKSLIPEASYERTENIQVIMHENFEDWMFNKEMIFYARSAYRNDPQFNISNIKRLLPILSENRISKLIDNDMTVSINYQRLATKGLEDVFENEDENTTIGEFRKKK